MKLAVAIIAAFCAQAAPLQMGRAAVKITPEPGTPMAGYYSTRLATGTHDDLHAKAIVLEKDGRKAALVACDLVALGPQVIEQARESAAKSTGIPAGNIMISATHSHTGPVITGRGARDAQYGGDMPILKRYMESLPAKIAESIRLANANLGPVRLQSGIGNEPSLAFNRRFFMKDGTVAWNPGKLNPNIIRPVGPIDPSVHVLYFDSPDGKPLATYVNYAVHLDTVGGLEFSADYPYTLARTLGAVKGADMLTLFTIGCAGNINHINTSSPAPQKGHAEAQRIGTVLAGEVIKTYTRLKQVNDGPLQASSQAVPLDLPKVTAEELRRANQIADSVNSPKPPRFLDTVWAFKAIDVAHRQGKPLEAEVQAITLGSDLAIVALPGEIFVEHGMAIQRASPFRHTIVVELAHGPATYIPDERAFPQGNYEVVSSRAAIGSGERMVDAANSILEKAWRNR